MKKTAASLMAGVVLASIGYVSFSGLWRPVMTVAGFVMGVVAAVATILIRRESDDVDTAMEDEEI